MTAQKPIVVHDTVASELNQIHQLYAVLSIVDQMVPAGNDMIAIPDEPELSHAFSQASGIAKKGFHSIASETAIAATAGARALLGKGSDPSTAAEELARYLRQELFQLGRFVGL